MGSTGQIDGETVGRGHFGGFDDEEEEEDVRYCWDQYATYG